MQTIYNTVEDSANHLRKVLTPLLATGGITKEQYIRYLQMQYHLTKGVQQPFLFIVAHERSRPYKNLRKFLIRFAYEEEMHFKLAQNDLKALNADVGVMPLDVWLWWSFYKQVMPEKPFIRLGATCILENIGNKTSDVIKALVASSDYLNPKNLSFLKVHMHEELPHGDQILSALAGENFKAADFDEIEEGCQIGFTLYARMIHWVLNNETIFSK